MPIQLEKLPGEPIIINTVISPFDMKQDLPTFNAQFLKLLEASDQPVYYIVDARAMSLGFSEIVQGLALITKGEFAHVPHPRIRQIVVVTDHEVIRMAANALRQAQYGGLSVAVFSTPEEALDYVRGELAR